VAGNARLLYALRFESASAAAQELAADPKYLGAQGGLVAVLHPWGQTLTLHPHRHVLATGGGLSCDRRGLPDEAPVGRGCRPGFFLPVRVLSRLSRGKYLAALRQAQQPGRLRRPAERAGPGAFGALLAGLYRPEGVVYRQPPCAGPEGVLEYLARYVQRVALSNSRLVKGTEQEGTFSSKDYRRAGKPKELTLARAEFVRRFLGHVLPRGLVRVRHYGLLPNRGREQELRLCRRLWLAQPPRQQALAAGAGAPAEPGSRRCRGCEVGRREVVEWLPRLVGGWGGRAGPGGQLVSGPDRGAEATRRRPGEGSPGSRPGLPPPGAVPERPVGEKGQAGACQPRGGGGRIARG
jgi:hypothetical protein